MNECCARLGLASQSSRPAIRRVPEMRSTLHAPRPTKLQFHAAFALGRRRRRRAAAAAAAAAAATRLATPLRLKPSRRLRVQLEYSFVPIRSSNPNVLALRPLAVLPCFSMLLFSAPRATMQATVGGSGSPHDIPAAHIQYTHPLSWPSPSP